ncbi:3D domain-containing protein, partial [Escherichia sp. SP-MK2]
RITASGIDIGKNPNIKLIAVDPKVIKLGTKVWVEGYGDAIAGDTGGAIKGNKIDVLFPMSIPDAVILSFGGLPSTLYAVAST